MSQFNTAGDKIAKKLQPLKKNKETLRIPTYNVFMLLLPSNLINMQSKLQFLILINDSSLIGFFRVATLYIVVALRNS